MTAQHLVVRDDDTLRPAIEKALVSHAAFPSPGGGGFIQCACGVDMLTVTEHATHTSYWVRAVLRDVGTPATTETRTDGEAVPFEVRRQLWRQAPDQAAYQQSLRENGVRQTRLVTDWTEAQP